MSNFKLSVLDQSISRAHDQGQQAFQETIEMAQWCESLGYERFWVSEHHGFPVIAGSAPEILIAALGARTQSIRLGAGGIMLPHYSAYKVAEKFSVLSNLYPNRIDLGVGRAPGTDMTTAMALASDGKPKFEQFPTLVEQLSDYCWSEEARPVVSPKPNERLPIWMLGSSPDSALLAAEKGLPYNLAAFINPQVDPKFIQLYQSKFQPSQLSNQPYSTLTIGAFCAEDEEQAKALRLNFDINFYLYVTGQHRGTFLTPQEAQLFPMTQELKQFINMRDRLRAVGTPEQVRQKIESLVDEFGVDEIMVVSNTYYLEDRKRSFKLLKEAFSPELV